MSVGSPSPWPPSCPPGDYASQSLDHWFRPSWSITEGRRGPEIEGYVYNDFGATAERMLLGIERLDDSGQVVGCATAWVHGTLPPGGRAFFRAPVPEPGARYRVRVIAFSWASKGGA